MFLGILDGKYRAPFVDVIDIANTNFPSSK